MSDATVRDLESFWIGYCVGLYEGEGTININRMASQNRVYARLVIRMTDREPVETMQRVFGGVVRDQPPSPYEATRGYKAKYRWTVGAVDDVIRLCNLMLPFLSPRRQAQIQIALNELRPRIRRKVIAGNKRNGELPTLRSRKTGELVCPAEPEPSARGYQRHRLLGIPCCDICRQSFRLYYAERRKWYKDKIRETNRARYLKDRDARVIQAREYRARKKQEGKSSEITD